MGRWRRATLTSLRAILRGAARSLGVERAANAALIEELWGEIVGPEAAARSRPLGMRGTVLLAEAEAGPWMQELSAQRGRFIREINRRLAGAVVTDIRFRQTSRPRPAGSPASPVKGAAADGGELSPEERTVVEQAVAEIADPGVREAARKAMISQMRWRKRRNNEDAEDSE